MPTNRASIKFKPYANLTYEVHTPACGVTCLGSDPYLWDRDRFRYTRLFFLLSRPHRIDLLDKFFPLEFLTSHFSVQKPQ